MGVGRYSEQDIRESARAFTGWNAIGTRFFVDAARHDDGRKTIFGREVRFDGVQAIDVILAQPATADYIARRIYRGRALPVLASSKANHCLNTMIGSRSSFVLR